MHAAATLVPLAAAVASAAQASLTIPVSRHTHQQLFAKPQAKSTNVVVPEVDDASFWFADFSVGASSSLSLLIDTGSSDVLLNPADASHPKGYYQPGATAKNLRRRFQISFATTNSDGMGTETLEGDLWQDKVSLSTLASATQELGNVTDSNQPTAFPHDGLVGFAGQGQSSFNGVPWFHSLCNAGTVQSCRFGLAYGTDGTGQQVLGGVDSKYADALSTVDIQSEWQTSMGVTISEQSVASDQTVVFDSGTSVIYGPIDTVEQIYEQLGIPTSRREGGEGEASYLYGYYPCDQPPTVGFELGGTNFDIVPSVWPAVQNGGNNCTGVLQGTDGFGDMWLVGQAFFQGHYIDHNVDAQTMGFARLQ